MRYSSHTVARILIVDDDSINRELLRAYLESWGYEVVEADCGEAGLRLAAEVDPDLVLLDVMMPGIDGFETARRLKLAAGSQFLPIILLTSLGDQPSRVLGLKNGADEYLTKPVDHVVLKFRLNNLLALRAKDRALTARNLELSQLSRFKDELTGMVVHDLKSPMSVILANLEHLEEVLEHADESDREALRDSRNAAQRMLRLVGNLLDISRLEERQFELRPGPTQVGRLLSGLAEERRLMAQSNRVQIDVGAILDRTVQVDADLLSRTVDNVFDNAIRHTPPGGRVQVQMQDAPTAIQLRIGNTGPAVPPEYRSRIFEKFWRVDVGDTRQNQGLGLYFCRLASEALGGRIWVEETVALPTVFVIELPV